MELEEKIQRIRKVIQYLESAKKNITDIPNEYDYDILNANSMMAGLVLDVQTKIGGPKKQRDSECLKEVDY